MTHSYFNSKRESVLCALGTCAEYVPPKQGAIKGYVLSKHIVEYEDRIYKDPLLGSKRYVLIKVFDIKDNMVVAMHHFGYHNKNEEKHTLISTRNMAKLKPPHKYLS